MKKYFLCLFIPLLVSCTDYLDVKPTSEIDKDVLFETEDGFFESLIGVYSRGSQSDLYGMELTFGFPDVIAQNYSITNDFFNYRQTALFNYGDEDFINRKDDTWTGLYNAISNCNLILEKLEENPQVFLNENNYSLIKGETLALRAYLHFDALRLFAPSYKQNPSAPAIPYVTTFTNEVTPQSTVTEALELIIADLVAAKKLLLEVDPILTEGYLVGYTTNGDFDGLPDDGSTEELREIFLQNRRHRMNYYAVCGSLARVYLYKEDKPKALENALEVINSGKFPWTDKLDFTADDAEEQDLILYKELLFSWFIPNMADDLSSLLESGGNALSVYTAEGNSIFETGGVGAEDYRYKQWLVETSDGISSRLNVRKYHRDPDGNKHHLVAPALRLSEMYYIAAECTFDTDPEQAWGYFNTVRFNRGIGTEIHGETSKDFFLTELLKEARKEFYAEGQIFYMYKRLNRNIVGQSGSIYTASEGIFVLPLPDDEIAFGQRN